MKVQRFLGVVLAIAMIFTCAFSASAVTYVHENSTVNKDTRIINLALKYDFNKTWRHTISIYNDASAFGNCGDGAIGVVKGGVFGADKAHSSATGKGNSKSVHVIARNGTGNAMKAYEDSGPSTAYVESSGTLWVAIGNLFYHVCSTVKTNHNLTYEIQ